VPSTDDLFAAAQRHAEGFPHGDASVAPVRRLAIVTCMDARLDPAALLGLSPGDAHVIRNAGAIVSDDVVRSLVVSQRYLGTTSILLIRHTECGLIGLRDADLRTALASETGVEPPWDVPDLGDVEGGLRDAVAELRASPWLTATEAVGGCVYDVRSGELRVVVPLG
jgi:carbonic anhydrase